MERIPLPAMPIALAALLDDGSRLWRAGQLEAAQARLEAALAQAAVLGSVAALLSARHLLGAVAYEQGALGEAREHHLFVLAECERYGIAVGIASSLHNLGLVSAALGDGVTARQQLLAAADRYMRLGMGEAAAVVRLNMLAITGGLPGADNA